MKQVLVDAARSIGQQNVALRVDTELLETVYISVEDDAIVVHDRGETFMYIRTAEEPGGDDTFVPWSRAAAQETLDRYSVDLVGYEDENEAHFRFQSVLAASDDVGLAVERLSSAIGAVFDVHTREDLR